MARPAWMNVEGGVAFVVECRMIQGYTSGRKDSGHDGSR